MTDTVRVPREPTEAMLVNGREALLPLVRLDSYGPLIGLWRDMLAASPQREGSSAEAQGWRDIATAPRDGSAFMVWWKGQWQPRARFDPEFGSFQLWGRTDYDTEGWETFAIDGHWMPLPPPPSAHPAPIKPSADTGELREKVAREIRDWPFPINQHEGCLELADAILDLIQSERRGPRVSILSTKFYGDNANGQPVFSGHADGVTNITLHGWTCFGPDEAGQKALAGFQSERAG